MKSFRSDEDADKNDVININGKKFETINLDGDLFPNWYNQRMRNNYQHLFDLLERKKYIYNRAGDYYRKMNLYFVIPSILITTISSIFAFLSTSNLINEENQDVFIILVGIMSAFSTMSQSLSSSVGFSTRKDMFLNAADQYDKNIIKISFEINNPTNQNLVKEIEADIRKIEDNCKYLPPNWILDEWNFKITKKVNQIYEDNFNDLNNYRNINEKTPLITNITSSE